MAVTRDSVKSQLASIRQSIKVKESQRQAEQVKPEVVPGAQSREMVLTPFGKEFNRNVQAIRDSERQYAEYQEELAKERKRQDAEAKKAADKAREEAEYQAYLKKKQEMESGKTPQTVPSASNPNKEYVDIFQGAKASAEAAMAQLTRAKEPTEPQPQSKAWTPFSFLDNPLFKPQPNQYERAVIGREPEPEEIEMLAPERQRVEESMSGIGGALGTAAQGRFTPEQSLVMAERGGFESPVKLQPGYGTQGQQEIDEATGLPKPTLEQALMDATMFLPVTVTTASALRILMPFIGKQALQAQEKAAVKKAMDTLRASKQWDDYLTKTIQPAFPDNTVLRATLGEEEALARSASLKGKPQPEATGLRGFEAPKVPEPPAIPKVADTPLSSKPVVTSEAGKGLTQDAQDLLAKVDKGGVPTATTRRIEKIAVENGIEVTEKTTPREIIDGLRAKATVKGVARELPGPAALPDIAPTSGGAAKIVSRSDMIKTLAETLEAPIKRGHFNQKALGIYKPGKEIIRIKAGSIRTATHEVGHLLDDRFKLSGQIPANEVKPLLTEYGPLRSYSVPAEEALAEFVRLYTTEPAKATAKAPGFKNIFDSFLVDNPDVAKVLNQTRDNFAQWLKANPEQRILSSISSTEAAPKITLADRLNRFYTNAFDDLHGIQKFRDLANKVGFRQAAQDDPYILARLTRGVPLKAQTFMEKGTFGRQLSKTVNGKAVPNYTGEGLTAILKPVGGKLDDFRAYLVARRAIVLEKRGIETGLLKGDARNAYTRLNAQHPEFAGVATKLYKYQDSLLQYAHESGLISPESLAKLRANSHSYVPFYRVMEEMQSRGMMGKAMANVKSPVRRIVGSERDIIDPLESIIKNTYAIIDASDRNQVGVALSRLSGKDKALAQLFEEIPAEMAKKGSINVADAFSDAEIAGMGITRDDLDRIVNLFRPATANSRENILTVMVGGKPKYYQADPDLFRAVMAMEKEDIGAFVRIISYPAKMLRAGATLSPEFFIAKNPLRDTMTAFAYSKYGFVPVVDTARGVFSLLRKDASYDLWRMSGGGRSMLVSMDRNYLQRGLENVLADKNMKTLNILKHPLDALERLSEITEAGTRIGEFKRGIARTATPEAAGFASREVSLDFGRRGAQTKSLNMMVAFFNANMQGMDKMAREMATNKKLWVKLALGITLPSIGLWMANHNDPRWKEIPQWQKDMFWIVMTPDNIYRIPKPFELGMLAGSLPERVLDYISDNDPNVLKEWALGAGENMTPGIIPTAILPIVENMTNWSFFGNRKIVSEGLTDEPPELQYTGTTPDVFIALAEQIARTPLGAASLGNWHFASPLDTQNIVRGYTAGLGQYGIQILDGILKGTGIAPPEIDPSGTLADVPVVKALVVRNPYGSGSQSVTKFYDTLEGITEAENYLKRMVEDGNDAKFKAYKAAHPEVYLRYDFQKDELYSESRRALTKVSSLLSDYRKAQRDIYNFDDMSPEDKRKKIDEIDLLITKTAVDALDAFKKPLEPSASLSASEIKANQKKKAYIKEVLKPYDDVGDEVMATLEAMYPGARQAISEWNKTSNMMSTKDKADYKARHPEVDAYSRLTAKERKRLIDTNPELKAYLVMYRGMTP